jgi:predicted nuclease of predicted toxin-antitoxin system
VASKRIGYHLDEHVDPIIAQALVHYGIQVATPTGVGLRAHGDAAQLMVACQRQLAIVTHDASFLRFTHDQGIHFGIIYCPHTDPTTSDLIRKLILIYEVLSPEELMGRVEIV